MSMIYYEGQKLRIRPDVYEPAEDTFLLADNLDVREGESVLELGTGCGLLSILAAEDGAEVVATDISPGAVRCAEENSRNGEVRDEIDFRTGDLFEPIEDEKFDLIIFNPPYLPVSPSESLDTELERAWDGGTSGRKIIDKFLDQVGDYLKPGGRFYFVQSSLSGTRDTLEKLERKGFQVDTKTKKLSFEELYFFRATY